MVALWEVLSDKGWALYPKEVSELMNSACTGSVLVNVENSLSEPNSFEIDLQTGTQTSSSGRTRRIRRIVWEYLDHECIVFDYHDAVLLEDSLARGFGNLWQGCLIQNYRVVFVAPDKHVQVNPKTSTRLIVKRLERHSHIDWICETEMGEKVYDRSDSELLEKMFRASLEDQVPVRQGTNVVHLALEPVHKLEEIDSSTGLATGVEYPLHRRVVLGTSTAIWVYRCGSREVVLSSDDCAKIEELFNKRDLVKLSDNSILNFGSMELTRAGATFKVFRTELPEGRTAFLTRNRAPFERALWQFWWKGGWKHMPPATGATLDSKCQVALSGRYVVDVQLLCQINTATGFVRSVRRVEWTYGRRARSYAPADARELEAAFLAGRAPVPVCGLRCRAQVNTAPMTLTDASGGGAAAVWRCVNAAHTLSAEDQVALERAWAAFRRVPLRGGTWTVDLAAMEQTNSATGTPRPVARAAVPDTGAESAALKRARAALCQWAEAAGGGV